MCDRHDRLDFGGSRRDEPDGDAEQLPRVGPEPACRRRRAPFRAYLSRFSTRPSRPASRRRSAWPPVWCSSASWWRSSPPGAGVGVWLPRSPRAASSLATRYSAPARSQEPPARQFGGYPFVSSAGRSSSPHRVGSSSPSGSLSFAIRTAWAASTDRTVITRRPKAAAPARRVSPRKRRGLGRGGAAASPQPL